MAISTGYRGAEDGERGWRRGLCAFLRSRIGVAALSAGSTLGLRAPDCAKESNVEAALPPLWTLFTLRRGCVGAYSRPLCVFAQAHWPWSLSAGSTLGLRAPDCAKESSTLWTLLRGWPSEKVRFTRRGCVGAYTRRRHPGTRKDPPNSNLWFGGSGCIAIISTRTIGDLPDSDLWSGRSCCIARQQVEAGTAGRVALRDSKCQPALPAAERCGCRAQPCLETFSMLRRTASSVA